MKRHLLDVGVLFVVASIATGYFVATEPSWRSVVLRIYVFVVGALAMFVILSASGSALPKRRRSDFELALSRAGRPPEKVSDLERVQREVTLGVGSAHDLHTRLAPDLREIATARLERNGRRLSPETAGRWWDLLRPDREPPDDKFARGIALEDLRACIDDLARIG